MEQTVSNTLIDNLYREIAENESRISSLTWRCSSLDLDPNGICELHKLEGFRDGLEKAAIILRLY